MRAHLRYLSYILRHKWYVFVQCCKLGIPWLGVIHDLSKFTPREWGAYARSYYAPDGTPRYAWTPEAEMARFYHQRRNRHHWQWWLYLGDTPADPVSVPVPMPDRYRRELLADWRGAARALGRSEAQLVAWYVENRERIRLHPDTRAWLERELGVEGAGDSSPRLRRTSPPG